MKEELIERFFEAEAYSGGTTTSDLYINRT